MSPATWAGLGAILLWGMLGLLTRWTQPMPVLTLTAASFAIGGLALLGFERRQPGWARLSALGLSAGGLGLYHLLFFAAIAAGPADLVTVVNYTWPLLIVLGGGLLLPGERLRPRALLGALLALAGVAVLSLGGDSSAGAGSGGKSLWPGLALAPLAALTWAGYSLLLRRYPAPDGTTGPACLLVALVTGLAALVLGEDPAPPEGLWGWSALLALGLGPVGLAFALWARAMCGGDLRILGPGGYATPVLSVLLLVAGGEAEPRPVLALAVLLVVLGAVLATTGGGKKA